MALDIYDSQYLVILAPSLVIALIFLFFWLFMKETSYDEVLARQKRDLKLPPSKPETRKKNDKKKSKKKESSSRGEGGESEEDLRDFDVADAVSSSTAEEEEEPAPVAAPAEAPAGVRERKKEKKAAKAFILYLYVCVFVENSEVKLKELLLGLGSLALSQAEAVSVVTVLKEKNPSALDAWQKSAAKADPSSLERERLLTTLQEEASIAKDKVQQLSKELQQEKQKTVRAEAVLRDQRGALEKELNVMQAKSQGELQGIQMKFQKLREQLEGQIARLQQENGILRDAVSSATNQMESKQSSELNQLRSEYSGLMKELTENNNKLQQEEHQRKSLEVNYKQNVSQLEEAKRRWDELQNYLHNVNAEREKLHLQSQLLAVETEMSNKNKEIQTLHSSLTDTIVSKDQVEQKVMQLLEVSQHSLADNSAQVQATTVSHFEELQKLLAEKELQRKSLEDSLNGERSSGATREINMQAMHNENMSLKAELQNLQAQISEQVRSETRLFQEREENIKTVEDLLKMGLIEVANKEEELLVSLDMGSIQQRYAWLAEKEKQVSDLQGELAKLRESLELHRNKNNELRVKNWSAMEALAATESMLQGKLGKALKEHQTALETAQVECRDVLHRLLPNVPLPTEHNHQEWLQRFETAVKEAPAAEGCSFHQILADKLKESEEAQKVLQKDCETYKKVLAETEGILQRLQSSVEQEESRWKVKLNLSQTELKEMSVKVAALEQEVDRLSDGGELDNLRRDKQYLESELERAEHESATYVTEVSELKTQLSKTLSKLETEERERQKVAGDLYKAQQSLDLIQEEICKETGQGDLIENSNLSSHEIDRKEKKTAGLNQTVRELQQLLLAVNRQLTKGQEAVRHWITQQSKEGFEI
uniref:Kinectin 1 n=1 Tax=Hucho hucho TaxID=62062 RepID=A0A4W5JXA9_9TELE